MITYYALEEETAESKKIKINTGIKEAMDCYILDCEYDMEEKGTVNDGDEITVKPNTVIFLVKN